MLQTLSATAVNTFSCNSHPRKSVTHALRAVLFLPDRNKEQQQ